MNLLQTLQSSRIPSFSEQAIAALQRENKTLDDINLIMTMLRETSFFDSLFISGAFNLIEQIIKRMSYQSSKKGSIVVRSGEASNRFFILLGGKIDVFRLKMSCQVDASAEENVELDSIKIETLQAGSCFGDIGISTKKSRLNCYVCNSDAQFSVLTTQDYVSLLKPFFDKKLLERVNLLSFLVCFDGLSIHFLKEIYLESEWRILKKGEFLFRECESPSSVVVLIKGQFGMLKNFLVNNKESEWGKYLEGQFDNCSSSLSSSHRKVKSLKILEFGNTSFVGEENVVNKQPRTYSIRCENAEGGEALIIPADIFKENIMQNSRLSKQILTMIPFKEKLYSEAVIRAKIQLFPDSQYALRDQQQQKLNGELWKNLHKKQKQNNLNKQEIALNQSYNEPSYLSSLHSSRLSTLPSQIEQNENIELKIHERPLRQSLMMNEKGEAVPFFEIDNSLQQRLFQQEKQQKIFNYLGSKRQSVQSDAEQICNILTLAGYFNEDQQLQQSNSPPFNRHRNVKEIKPRRLSSLTTSRNASSKKNEKGKQNYLGFIQKETIIVNKPQCSPIQNRNCNQKPISLKPNPGDYPLTMNEPSRLNQLNGIYKREGNQTINTQNNDRNLRTSIIHSRCQTVENYDYPTSPQMKQSSNVLNSSQLGQLKNATNQSFLLEEDSQNLTLKYEQIKVSSFLQSDKDDSGKKKANTQYFNRNRIISLKSQQSQRQKGGELSADTAGNYNM